MIYEWCPRAGQINHKKGRKRTQVDASHFREDNHSIHAVKRILSTTFLMIRLCYTSTIREVCVTRISHEYRRCISTALKHTSTGKVQQLEKLFA